VPRIPRREFCLEVTKRLCAGGGCLAHHQYLSTV